MSSSDEARPFKHTRLCPTYKPGDPRIEQTLRRGSGVAVDYEGLSETERRRWMLHYKTLEGVSNLDTGVRLPGPNKDPRPIRTHRDAAREAKDQAEKSRLLRDRHEDPVISADRQMSVYREIEEQENEPRSEDPEDT
jgi:hypothetical protein